LFQHVPQDNSLVAVIVPSSLQKAGRRAPSEPGQLSKLVGLLRELLAVASLELVPAQ